MNLRRLFSVYLPFALCFGLTCALVPRQLCAAYGLTADAGAVWTTRLLGGSILGFATLMWFGWRSADVEPRRAIAFALHTPTSCSSPPVAPDGPCRNGRW